MLDAARAHVKSLRCQRYTITFRFYNTRGQRDRTIRLGLLNMLGIPRNRLGLKGVCKGEACKKSAMTGKTLTMLKAIRWHSVL
jgi:hypothetical protein